MNVKTVEFITDASVFSDYVFKPQLRLLGRKFGKQIGEVREALSKLNGRAARRELSETGKLVLSLTTGPAELLEEELLIETSKIEGFASVTEKGITVILDTNLTPELIEEGFVREVISKIQSMRRDSDFDVMDHIIVYASGSEKVMAIIDRNRGEISHDVLADEILINTDCDISSEWDINGESAKLGVKRV